MIFRRRWNEPESVDDLAIEITAQAIKPHFEVDPGWWPSPRTESNEHLLNTMRAAWRIPAPSERVSRQQAQSVVIAHWETIHQMLEKRFLRARKAAHRLRCGIS